MTTTLTRDQLIKVANILAYGNYGSFMSAIGCALQLADSNNTTRLVQAFGDVFERVYNNAIEAEKLEA